MRLPTCRFLAYNTNMALKSLVAIPVYNEAAHVSAVVDGVLTYAKEVLVVDDGSTDGTSALLSRRCDVDLVRHCHNRGYGAALQSAFDFAVRNDYDILVTIDCDGQHQPQQIPRFVEMAEIEQADIVSGSRFLRHFPGDSDPPEERRRVNEVITRELNELLGLEITDAFCGFKAYRVEALKRFRIDDHGYSMPLQLWVQAAKMKMKVVEVPTPLIYLDQNRSFGGSLDDVQKRLALYREVIARSVAEWDRKNPE